MKSKHAPGKSGSGSKTSQQQAGAKQPVAPARNPYAGKPLDGSQYVDIIEEQEYADRRPTPEEQQPRFSYLHPPPPTGRRKK